MPSTLEGRAQRQRQPWPPWGAKRPCLAAMLVATRRSLICSLSLQKLKMSASARLCRLHKLQQPARLRHVLASSGRCDEASGLRSRVLSHSCGITNVISTRSGSGSVRPSTSSPLPFAPARTAVQRLVILQSRDGDEGAFFNLQIAVSVCRWSREGPRDRQEMRGDGTGARHARGPAHVWRPHPFLGA